MSCLFNIDPTWNIDDYKNLTYTLDKHKDQELNDQYIKAGHQEVSLSLYNYFEPNPMPKSIEYIKSYFTKYNKISVAINLFKPGQYMPFHYDLFQKFKKYHNVEEGSNICRYMVMLEDSYQGQMLQVGDRIYNQWQAGDVYGWCGYSMHTFYNLGINDRYAVQITGAIC